LGGARTYRTRRRGLRICGKMGKNLGKLEKKKGNWGPPARQNPTEMARLKGKQDVKRI